VLTSRFTIPLFTRSHNLTLYNKCRALKERRGEAKLERRDTFEAAAIKSQNYQTPEKGPCVPSLSDSRNEREPEGLIHRKQGPDR
jgi:hypothetical protein